MRCGYPSKLRRAEYRGHAGAWFLQRATQWLYRNALQSPRACNQISTQTKPCRGLVPVTLGGGTDAGHPQALQGHRACDLRPDLQLLEQARAVRILRPHIAPECLHVLVPSKHADLNRAEPRGHGASDKAGS